MKNLRKLSELPPLKSYPERHEMILKDLARNVERFLNDILHGLPRIDRVSARAKSPDSYINKSLKKQPDGELKYENPLDQIQDQVGARVVVLYSDDVEVVSRKVTSTLTKIEEKRLVPESEYEFGYFGKHFVFFLPEDVKNDDWSDEDIPTFFELQIKTLYQHAWSEASHDLAYKAGNDLTSNQKRRFAFTAAQSWGADEIFSALFNDLDSTETDS